MRKYGRIITQFMIFSPTLYPKDVPGFLRHKFHLESLGTGPRFSWNGTLKQCITHIKRFYTYFTEINLRSAKMIFLNIIYQKLLEFIIHWLLIFFSNLCNSKYSWLLWRLKIIHLLFSLNTTVDTLLSMEWLHQYSKNSYLLGCEAFWGNISCLRLRILSWYIKL